MTQKNTEQQSFEGLGLCAELLAALKAAGYEQPTPIQAQAIGPALKGRDLLGLAQTGTGKTAAFALPILHHLAQTPRPGRAARALVLAPTRELAMQILDSVRGYSKKLKLLSVLIVGGSSQERQVNDLKRGVDIIIATPGRLEDLQEQRLIDLTQVRYFVLDEADRMLDIGFMPAIRRIAASLPKQKQTLFFSATMPAQVATLARELLPDPVRIEVTPESTPVDRIAQEVVLVPVQEKRQVLVDFLSMPQVTRAIVFTRTKHGADKVARTLQKAKMAVGVMHGRKSQNARQTALGDFERGKLQVLVATDIAARGIDVDDVSHVFNFDLPNEPETYVHRIGRTARAGKSGVAISLCDMHSDEKNWLRQIEKLTRMKIPTGQRPPASGFVVTTGPGSLEPEEEQEHRPRPQHGRPPQKKKTKSSAAAHGQNAKSGSKSGSKPASGLDRPQKPQSWQKRKRLAQGKGRPQPN